MKTEKNFIIDMDGVLVHGRTIIPGADTFIDRLRSAKRKFVVLTNNPLYTPGDLSHRLKIVGLDIPRENIFTSAMATARFLDHQAPAGKAFVIGGSGLTSQLHEVGYIITDHDPEVVVLGETQSYDFEAITKAIRFVARGARFIATNPDASGPTENGIVPACGAMAALIERATGCAPFFVGKPNPLMMRTALNHLNVHSEETVMVGDRMETDIIGGIQAGMETVLVLSGLTTRDDIQRFPYRPSHVVNSVADIEV